MTITGYHGTAGQARLHVGLCITRDEVAAECYALRKNCRDHADETVTEIAIDTEGLRVVEVDYDYDETEPIIPDDLDADIIEYLDCDMTGGTHLTWCLMTERAVAAAGIIGSYHVEEQ